MASLRIHEDTGGGLGVLACGEGGLVGWLDPVASPSFGGSGSGAFCASGFSGIPTNNASR